MLAVYLNFRNQFNGVLEITEKVIKVNNMCMFSIWLHINMHMIMYVCMQAHAHLHAHTHKCMHTLMPSDVT